MGGQVTLESEKPLTWSSSLAFNHEVEWSAVWKIRLDDGWGVCGYYMEPYTV